MNRITPTKKTLLGSNVPAIGGLTKAFEVADQWGCDCMQIYVTPSRRWLFPDWSDGEVSEIMAARARSRVKRVVAHVPFLVNIASPNQALRAQSTRRLAVELARANQIGVEDLVLHPGSHGSSEPAIGITRIIQGLREVFESTPDGNCRIALETMAGQGSTLGSRFEDILEILEGANNAARLSVCLDTCHLFAAGHKFTGYDGYEETITKIIAMVGLERISVVHLNDSLRGCGSRIDRHASIGEGMIGYEAFHAFVRDQRFNKIPKILEIPDRDERSVENLKLLRKLEELNGSVTQEFVDEWKGRAYASVSR